MGKFSKQKSFPVSAFAAYSMAQENAKTKNMKRERADSEASILNRVGNVNTNTNLEKCDSKVSVGSTSFVKQMSNKAVFSLKRGSIKRKNKKLKKLAEATASSHWRPSDPGEQIPVLNFSNAEKPCFKGMKRKESKSVLKSNIQNDGKTKNSPSVVYKEAQSIELSSSLSLSGEDSEGNNVLTKPHSEGTNMSMDLVIPSEPPKCPPKKRVRLEAPQLQLHGNNQDSSSVSTISKKSSCIPKIPFPRGDSEKDGKVLFEWLIHPFTVKKFFSNIWEKKPLQVKRHITNYAEGLFSTEDFNQILTECNVRFGVNLDVTTYQNGVRETHNVAGRAYAPVVWDYYKNDCSVRMKNPQAFSKPVWKLCSTLQEYFKSMVGANIYLTPPGSQGFAPHYDDIEAFVLQLEGKKHWTLYNPRSDEETLPRYSSKNFEQNEIGTEIFSTVLEAGDLLYFPRGFIHQAKSLPDSHSLHITISTYQKNSWGDFMEELVPVALSKACAEDVEFRKGLPLDYMTYLGVQNSDKKSERRQEMLSQVANMFRRLANHIDADAAADARSVEFLYSALPPVFSQDENSRSIYGALVNLSSPGNPSAWICGIDVNTKIRVVRKNALRLCVNMDPDDPASEDVRVYHSVQNSRVYHEEEKKYFDLESNLAPALEYLIDMYPDYATVESLPLSSDTEKVSFANFLYEKGILITEKDVKMVKET